VKEYKKEEPSVTSSVLNLFRKNKGTTPIQSQDTESLRVSDLWYLVCVLCVLCSRNSSD
jgi:hypothetical protein